MQSFSTRSVSYGKSKILFKVGECEELLKAIRRESGEDTP